MAMLAEVVEVARRVDTHKHTHTAAVVAAASGAMVAQVTVMATPAGHRQLLKLTGRQASRRVWAVEGTGGYGAGLTRFLQANTEQVVELDRPTRPDNCWLPAPACASTPTGTWRPPPPPPHCGRSPVGSGS
jgi:transposase